MHHSPDSLGQESHNKWLLAATTTITTVVATTTTILLRDGWTDGSRCIKQMESDFIKQMESDFIEQIESDFIGQMWPRPPPAQEWEG
jgi:hypothetical protein